MNKLINLIVINLFAFLNLISEGILYAVTQYHKRFMSMNNPFKNTVFVTGVREYKSMPQDKGVEVVLAGRSNAGKSSALNALVENPKLARTSKTPGRTTEVNFFKVNEKLKLLDLPGYGYAKTRHKLIEGWGSLISEYFLKRASLKALILFMDIRRPLRKSDINVIDLCKKHSVDCIPTLTKADKLSNNRVATVKREVVTALNIEDVIVTSTVKNIGFKSLSSVILSYQN